MNAHQIDGNYKSLLRSSVDILGECTSLIDDKDSNSNETNSIEFSAFLNAFTLSIMRNYANDVDARIHAVDLFLESDALRRECQSRHDAAEDSDNNIEAIRKVYSCALRPKSTQYRQNAERDSVLSSFASDCETLLQTRNRESFPVSKELCRILLDAYRSQNGNDDEIVDVSDSFSAPRCVLSKEVLKNPVVGPCRHYFSEEVIKASIAQGSGSSIDCPSAGCNQKLNYGNLVRDYFKDLEISQLLQIEELRRRKASVNMAHV